MAKAAEDADGWNTAGVNITEQDPSVPATEVSSVYSLMEGLTS